MEPVTLPSPPALAVSLLEITIPLQIRECLIGDLGEEYVKRLATQSTLTCDIWFWKQTLTSSYEFANKQQGGVMAFVISLVLFTGVLLMGMILSGSISMFFNGPSFILVFPVAVAMGLVVTSKDSMKLGIKLCVSEQDVEDIKAIRLSARFFKTTGNIGLLMGIMGTILGWIAMASNIEPDVFPQVFGPAMAVSLLTLLYALILKIVCYLAEQKITNHYLLDT